MKHVLRREQIVQKPLREVFDFFERPENLSRITPASLGFSILTPGPIVMRVGTLLDYQIRLLGIPVRWRTLITAYDPPFRFTDEQLRGPYDFWHHTHTFEEISGGTRLRDEVHYAMGMGPLGGLLNTLYVKRSLARIFDHRAAVIADYFARIQEGTELTSGTGKSNGGRP